MNMNKQSLKRISLALVVIAGLSACNATMKDRVLDTNSQRQLQKRSYQSRAFDTADKEKVLRATIATLQDLGFVIDRADLTLGTISATKLNAYLLKMTVSVRAKGKEQMIVRANAQFNVTPLEDPKPYQDFFNSLGKSLFLQAQEVD